MATVLDCEGLAKILEINPQVVLRHARMGLIPHHRIGQAIRFTLEDVLAATRVGTHSDDKAVDGFASALHDRMALARGDGAEGWEERSLEELAQLLAASARKGNVVNLGVYAAMLHSRSANPSILAGAFECQ